MLGQGNARLAAGVKGRLSAVTVLLASVAMGAVAGCQSSQPTQYEQIVKDPSPNAYNRTADDKQRRGDMAYTIDTNERSLHDDLGRFLLLDRPSRLSQQRVP
jgi:hypothetical protein